MKILNVSGVPLTGAVYAEARRLLRAGRKVGAVPGGDGVLFTLIAEADRIVVVNGLSFAIISAEGTVVRWSGGTPPFTVSVERGDLPASFANVDQSVYTLTEREFSVLTRHQKDLVDDDYDWWAANDELVNDEAVQTSVGVIIEDSSEPPRRIYAPFGGIEGVYEHFGPETWCIPIIRWTVPSFGRYGSAAIPSAEVFVPGDDLTPLPGAFVYDPPQGSALGVGVHTVSVTFNATDEIHYREAVETRTITVAKALQTISGFAVSGDGYFTSTHTLLGSASSGLPISFICYASEVVVDYGTSPPTITFPQPGTYTIYATQPGNENFEMAPQQEIVRVITSHMPDANMTVDALYGWGIGKVVQYTDTTPAHPDGATITLSWAITQRPSGSTAGMNFYNHDATQISDGTHPGDVMQFTPDIAGTYTVRLTATDQWDVSKFVTNTFNVGVANQTIAFDVTPNPLGVGATADVIITNSGTGTGTWAVGSDNWSIAEPLTGFKIRGIGAGSTVITLWKQSTDPNYADAYATLSLTVQVVTPALTYTVLNVNTLQVSGGTAPYSAAVSPSGSTGGFTLVKISSNQFQLQEGYGTSGCYCYGAGLLISDSAGHSVTAPFGVGGYLQSKTLCTSGCPGGEGGSDPEWGSPVWMTDRTGGPTYFNYMEQGNWNWVHIGGDCYAAYGDSFYPPEAQTAYEPWTLYPQEAVSQNGQFKIEFAYITGSLYIGNGVVVAYNDIPGHSLSELNAQTGLNFSLASFGLCDPGYAMSSILRIKKLYAK